MIKSFWTWFTKYAAHGILLAVFFWMGFYLGDYFHPYEKCTVGKGYTNPEDIGECIWLLQNQPALRN